MNGEVNKNLQNQTQECVKRIIMSQSTDRYFAGMQVNSIFEI
jgi:hypothetical protein